jgi:protein phosphatase 2C family protein 2/3
VFDGHGGNEISDHIRDVFTQELEKNDNYKAGDYEKALIETFIKVDDDLLEDRGLWGELNSVGSCATMVLISPTKIYCANLGDSRTMLSEKGICQVLTTDHKPTN